jgi:hypothetical protein
LIPKIQPTTTLIATKMESQIQEAPKFLEGNPGTKISTVAKEFGVSRHRLRNRIEGRLPKKGYQPRTQSFRDLKRRPYVGILIA